MTDIPIVERLMRYSEYVASELNGITPGDAIDLRVGPRMCVEAMQKAAALLKECVEALEEITALKPLRIGETPFCTGPQALLDQAKNIARATLAAMTKGAE